MRAEKNLVGEWSSWSVWVCVCVWIRWEKKTQLWVFLLDCQRNSTSENHISSPNCHEWFILWIENMSWLTHDIVIATWSLEFFCDLWVFVCIPDPYVCNLADPWIRICILLAAVHRFQHYKLAKALDVHCTCRGFIKAVPNFNFFLTWKLANFEFKEVWKSSIGWSRSLGHGMKMESLRRKLVGRSDLMTDITRIAAMSKKMWS